MPRVQIHCYGCRATVPVATAKSSEDLNRAGWSLAHGETYCPKCASAPVPSPVAASEEGDGEEGSSQPHLARLRPVAALVLSALRLPFRRSNAPATSRSKLSSQTIALFCIAAALTLATLGSEHMAIRLPGVLFSLAAGVSWLRDLRSSA
jgi:hypothetical protein